ncbi:MAG: hypothetical protein ACLUOI_25885 [Eisenbergiella sp.]
MKRVPIIKALEQGIRALAYNGSMALAGWFKECHIPIHLGREGHFNQQNIFFSGTAASRTGITQGGILTGYAKKAGNCWEQGKYSVRTLYIRL